MRLNLRAVWRDTMSRKSRKGYYVDGEFVPAGSDADQRFRDELRDSDSPSRTQLKQVSEQLQQIGEALTEMQPARRARLPLPEKLQEAITEARRITNFGARRRQLQFVGKLMRGLDPEVLEAVNEALRVEQGESVRESAMLHQAEEWRDALIADDERLGRWIDAYPDTDSQQLRALIRQARKDAQAATPGEPRRHGRAYREIFQLVREQLKRSIS
jgi:ribosome-associated protein